MSKRTVADMIAWITADRNEYQVGDHAEWDVSLLSETRRRWSAQLREDQRHTLWLLVTVDKRQLKKLDYVSEYHGHDLSPERQREWERVMASLTRALAVARDRERAERGE